MYFWEIDDAFLGNYNVLSEQCSYGKHTMYFQNTVFLETRNIGVRGGRWGCEALPLPSYARSPGTNSLPLRVGAGESTPWPPKSPKPGPLSVVTKTLTSGSQKRDRASSLLKSNPKTNDWQMEMDYIFSGIEDCGRVEADMDIVVDREDLNPYARNPVCY